MLDHARGAVRQGPFRAVNQPELVDDLDLVFHDLNRILSGKGLSRIAWQHRKAEASGDGFENQADLVAETVAWQFANQGFSGEAAAQQAIGHGLSIRVVDEAEPHQIGPAFNRGSGRCDQLQRLLGEHSGRNARIVRLQRQQPEFVTILQTGFQDLAVRGETMTDDESGIFPLEIQQQRIQCQPDAAGTDQADFAAIGVLFMDFTD